MAEDVALLVDLQRLERDGAAHRMAGIGEAVGEAAELARSAPTSGAIDRLGDDGRGDRQIGRRQRLRHGHDVGRDAERLAAEHVAGAAEAADHLVGDEQHVVLAQHLLDLREIARRRHDHAARAHHRLGDEGGDGVGILALDQRVEVVGQPRRRNPPRSRPAARVAVVMRAVGVADAGDRQVEIEMVGGSPVRLARRDGDAVIAPHAAR